MLGNLSLFYFHVSGTFRVTRFVCYSLARDRESRRDSINRRIVMSVCTNNSPVADERERGCRFFRRKCVNSQFEQRLLQNVTRLKCCFARVPCSHVLATAAGRTTINTTCSPITISDVPNSIGSCVFARFVGNRVSRRRRSELTWYWRTTSLRIETHPTKDNRTQTCMVMSVFNFIFFSSLC